MALRGAGVSANVHSVEPENFDGMKRSLEAGKRVHAPCGQLSIADALLERGVYVIAFSYPVVPMGKARIRVQISAGHSADDIAACAQAFADANRVTETVACVRHIRVLGGLLETMLLDLKGKRRGCELCGKPTTSARCGACRA